MQAPSGVPAVFRIPRPPRWKDPLPLPRFLSLSSLLRLSESVFLLLPSSSASCRPHPAAPPLLATGAQCCMCRPLHRDIPGPAVHLRSAAAGRPALLPVPRNGSFHPCGTGGFSRYSHRAGYRESPSCRSADGIPAHSQGLPLPPLSHPPFQIPRGSWNSFHSNWNRIPRNTAGYTLSGTHG